MKITTSNCTNSPRNIKWNFLIATTARIFVHLLWLPVNYPMQETTQHELLRTKIQQFDPRRTCVLADVPYLFTVRTPRAKSPAKTRRPISSFVQHPKLVSKQKLIAEEENQTAVATHCNRVLGRENDLLPQRPVCIIPFFGFYDDCTQDWRRKPHCSRTRSPYRKGSSTTHTVPHQLW